MTFDFTKKKKLFSSHIKMFDDFFVLRGDRIYERRPQVIGKKARKKEDPYKSLFSSLKSKKKRRRKKKALCTSLRMQI